MIVRWDDLLGGFDPSEGGEDIFYDIGLFDIPETIELSIRNITHHKRIIAVSVCDLPQIWDAAIRGAEGSNLRLIPRPFICSELFNEKGTNVKEN